MEDKREEFGIKFQARVVEIGDDGFFGNVWIKVRRVRDENPPIDISNDLKIQVSMLESKKFAAILGESIEVSLQYAPSLKKIDHLEISKRTYDVLKRCRIDTIKNLVTYSEYRLLRINGLGQISVNEIKRALSKRGLSLKGD